MVQSILKTASHALNLILLLLITMIYLFTSLLPLHAMFDIIRGFL